MKQSVLFTKTSKNLPKNETSFNAQALIRAGFIDKLGAGIYSYLPLGMRVLNKINDIVKQEMNKIGGQEILLPALNPKENWQKTGRWETLDVLFKLSGADKKEYALGATHEEIVTPLLQKHIFSYKELPVYAYQIQTKFRNELRAKSGLLRGREFLMKDLYSFHTKQEDLDNFYKIVQKAYFKIYERCGILDKTYLTYAAGGTFSKYSHEFQTVTEAGEDKIYICDSCNIAINEEIIEEQKVCPLCSSSKFREEKAVEVGNIFKLGTKFSDAFSFNYADIDGKEKPVIMGCYGLGPSRVMGTVVEISNDSAGIIWPEEIAPFKVHLIALSNGKQDIENTAEKVYNDLLAHDIDVIYDDRDIGAGQKLADADLIGCPYRIVISEKTLKKQSIELKYRAESNLEMIKIDELVNILFH